MTPNILSFARGTPARRYAFVAGNLVALVLILFATAAPLRRYILDRADNLAQRRAILARYDGVVARAGAVEDYARSVAESNARGELIEGGAEGIVSANLQAHLRRLADGAGVTVRSLQTLPAKTLRGATLVGARVEVSGSMEAVHGLARAFDSDAPLLLVTAASLRGQMALWGEMSGSEHVVEAQFDVYGGALGRERS
jgi:general secretion pathway protein M